MKVNKAIALLRLLTVILVLTASTEVFAQGNSNTNQASPAASATPTPAASVTPSPTSSPTPEIRVISARKLGEASTEEQNKAGIGDIIIIEVKNLMGLVKRSKCLKDDDTKKPDCREQEIALFLDGRKIEGIKPESGAPEVEKGTVQFHLQRNVDKNDEAWADLLGAPPLSEGFFERNTGLSVGLADEYALPTDITDKSGKFKLIRIRQWRFWFFTILLIALLGLLFWLGIKSDILRDVGEQPTDSKKRKPFSLARCQMAYWFFLVIASFIYIWQITGAYDIITAGVLALIGIGSGTALGAAVIDVSKREGVESELRTLEAQEKTLQDELKQLMDQIKAVPTPDNLSDLQKTESEKKNSLNEVQSKIDQIEKTIEPLEERSFLNDILSDATGITFHRFQMFIWTIVLGIVFLYSVWARLSMPEFSATLLALLGISAGTYLGFKIPEKQA